VEYAGVQLFNAMQVVINKCFLLNPEKKIWRRSALSFLRKTQKIVPLIPKNSDELHQS